MISIFDVFYEFKGGPDGKKPRFVFSQTNIRINAFAIKTNSYVLLISLKCVFPYH